MKNNLDDALILNLAKTLASKQVSPDIISKSLKLICNAFSFDCGLVYEMDQNNNLHLKERCISHETPLQECFALEDVHSECHSYLVKQTISYISEKNYNTSCEKKLLEYLSSSSLVIYPLVDEGTHILGLIVYLHISVKEDFLPPDLKTLEVVLSMIGNYMIIRAYGNKLTFTQTSFQSILDNTGIDIYVNDFYNHDILYVNKSMAAPYGGVSKFLGNKCWSVLFPGQSGPCEFCPQKKLIDEDGNPTQVYSWDYQRAFDGSWFRVFSTAFRWVDGRLAHLVSSADITENKKNEELIQYMANYDPLTNLPNRRMLVNECERRIDRATESEKGYILYFDIDRFKEINDNFGHDAGDEFLMKLGGFFSDIPMLKDSFYRNGGDEFVAVIGGNITKAHIQSLVSFIHDRFTKPWVLKTGDVFCNISVGVARYPEDGQTAEELLSIADKAMYQVKKAGGSGICFGSQL